MGHPIDLNVKTKKKKYNTARRKAKGRESLRPSTRPRFLDTKIVTKEKLMYTI